MDFIRLKNCGVYRAKFWKDDPRETLVRWVMCPPGTPTFPYPHAFGNISMMPDWQSLLDVPEGKVGCGGRRVRFSSKPAPFAKRVTHFCGTPEQFLEGSKIAEDAPLRFGPSGYSTCCMGDQVLTFLAGGVRVGGTASFSSGSRPAGGVRVGGTAFPGSILIPTGGVRVGGTAFTSPPFTAQGGVRVGGEATF
jgi:hypothetical protein